MADAVEPPKAVGHADISTTKKMYAHIEIEPLKKAMYKFIEYMEIES